MIFLIIVILLFYSPLFSEFVNTYEFLNIPESGRADIISESGITTPTGIISVYGNPAGYAKNQSTDLIFSDTENIGDTRKLSLFYGSGFNYFNYIIGIKYFYLKEALYYNNNEIAYNSYTLESTFAKNIFKNFDIGISFIYFSSRIYHYTTSGILLNCGIIYHFFVPYIGEGKKRNFSVGFYIKNIGYLFSHYYNEAERLNFKYSGGIKYAFFQLKNFSSTINFSSLYYNKFYFAPGINFTIFKFFTITTGYKIKSNPNLFTIGISIKTEQKETLYNLNYSIISESALNPVHSISLIISR